MEKIIVYGLGIVWSRIRRTISNKYEIIGYADKKNSISGKEIWKPEELVDKDFDYILITPRGCKIEIMDELEQLGIDRAKLIPYFGENKYIDKKQIYRVGNEIVAELESCKLHIKTFSDEAVFKEVFIDRGYSLEGLGDFSVIDIGMNVGFTSIFFAMQDEVKNVYGFEPFSRTYQDALENIRDCDAKDKIHTFNCALSNQPGRMTVNYDLNDSESMSIVVDNKGEASEEIAIEDAGEQLTQIIKSEIENGRHVVCKMDCEGSEYAIFESLDKVGLIQKIDVFLLEWHILDDDTIADYLKKYGFIFIKDYSCDNMGHIIAWKSGN